MTFVGTTNKGHKNIFKLRDYERMIRLINSPYRNKYISNVEVNSRLMRTHQDFLFASSRHLGT